MYDAQEGADDTDEDADPDFNPARAAAMLGGDSDDDEEGSSDWEEVRAAADACCIWRMCAWL